MKEDFLQFIWNTSRFDMANLKTVNGESISIIKPGILNTLSGPDFSEAIIKIGKTTWAGHVEIHVKASDWEKHKHSQDKAYENVILHVVYKNDKPVFNNNGEEIPCLILDGLISKPILTKYQFLQTNKSWIPCQGLLDNVNSMTKSHWVERVAVQRLERKSESILALAGSLNFDWTEVFYRTVAQSFGYKANNPSMAMLAENTPIKILAKHKHNLMQIEAILYGQAGFLNQIFTDEYPNKLKKEYRHLKQKYSLIGLEKHQWKFGGMRPPNFPTIKIAQLSMLIHQSSHLFSKILETIEVQNIRKLFELSASNYWNTHYRFDVETKSNTKKLGDSALNGLLINTVAPLIFAYGTYKGEYTNNARSVDFLSQIQPEKNKITREWEALKFINTDALYSQGLIELKNEFCNKKKCFACGIGNVVLK